MTIRTNCGEVKIWYGIVKSNGNLLAYLYCKDEITKISVPVEITEWW